MVQYRASKERHYQQDIGEYISWGIKAYCISSKGSETAVVDIPDIFLNGKEAVDFAMLCTKMELSPIHFRDVVNDYLEGFCMNCTPEQKNA